MIICFIFGLNCSCDADPSALAKYVVALVKKDKSEKDLKALCIDQLDVFLQKGKKSFDLKKLYFAVSFGLYSLSTLSTSLLTLFQRPNHLWTGCLKPS